MDSLYWNKWAAAVLTAGIAFFVSGFLGTRLVHMSRPHETAIQIDIPEGGGTAAPPAAADSGPKPINALLASADVAAGQANAQKLCGACHNFAKGGANGIGPNLYGIVGAPHAHAAGFNYSAAIKGKAGPWNYDELNAWLYKPAAYAPGTRMAFAGISSDKQRAEVIAYLKSISPEAPPLPAGN